MSVPKRLLTALDARDGRVCAWHGESSECDPETLVPQHRQGGMGGRKGKHRLSNLVWLDSLTNGLIEADAGLQAEAVRRGIKISGFDEPSHAPIHHAVHGLCLLDDYGGVHDQTVVF